jgi:ribulose-phosphate 3-epimerase
MVKIAKIIPALLAKDFNELKDKVKFLGSKYQVAQIDVMDGRFVKNKTFSDFNKIKAIKTPLKYELHLMVKEPLKFVKKYLASADPSAVLRMTASVIVHYEALKTADATKFLALRSKVKIGLAINPKTPVTILKKYCGLIDILLIMGVVPGKSGQKFLPATLNKIKTARKLCPQIEIEVDGGVNKKNVQQILNAGADCVASATMVFENY